jgi:hypothetical protein
MREFLKSIARNDIRNILAVMATIFAFSFLTVLVFVELPERNRDIINTLGGVVIGGTVVAAFAFYFGNSKNNKSNGPDQKV